MGVASALRASWDRLSQAERLALAMALVPAALLWAPWTRVTSEPLCIFPPCPAPQATTHPAFDAAPALLLAAAGLLAALALALVPGRRARHLAAVAPLLPAALLAALAPDWPSIHVFEHLSGLGWGVAAATAAAAAALALIASTWWAGRGPRPDDAPSAEPGA